MCQRGEVATGNLTLNRIFSIYRLDSRTLGYLSEVVAAHGQERHDCGGDDEHAGEEEATLAATRVGGSDRVRCARRLDVRSFDSGICKRQ